MKGSKKTKEGLTNARETLRPMKSNTSIATLDEKIGKVISEIK